MTDAKTAAALFKAITSGDASKVSELLAAGAPVESRDANQMTPVMLAAQAGKLEVFHVLLARGADVNAVALSQKDLLECAAEGGNVEIVRHLLERGHPVNGHWQPRSKVSERAGHLTPLLMAAINAHPDVVRLLLDAGANRLATFDGQSALALLQEEIKHPVDADAGRKARLERIAAMLAAGGGRSREAELASAVAKFAENARRPEYARLRSKLAERCGGGRPWHPVQDHGLPAADVLRYKLPRGGQQTLDNLQAEAVVAGSQLVLEEPWTPGDDAALVLFPTDDKLAVVAAVGTEGANDGVQTNHILDWIGELDRTNPLRLVWCAHDMVGGEFTSAVKNVSKVAARMAEICPDSRGDGGETPAHLAQALKRDRKFLLRWG